MKKYLLSVFAAASMLFAASCSEEENFAESNKQSVTFKVEVEDAGASSRALSNGKDVGQGSLVNKVYYAVYEADGGEFLTSGNAVMTPTANGTVGSVVIPLVNGLPFDIVFFAHHEKENNDVNESAFIIPDNGDLTKLQFNTNLKANQESYDAFYNTLPGFQTTNNSTTPVKLTRAVAQLNVGTTVDDLINADALKALATMSKITLTNVPTKFNARTGEVDENTRTSVTFDASNILMDANWVDKPYKNEILKDVKTNDGVKDFYYLAMAYVLAGHESALHDATFTFYRGADKEIISERSLSSVRLQRNYRTNVTGNVLTQQEKFDVSLDINFGDDKYNYSVGDVVVVANEKQFEEVIKKNAEEENPVPVEIQLNGDITLGGSRSVAFSRAENELPYALKIDADQEITIDLNGFTISHQKACDGSYSMIENNGKLTILDSSANETGKIRFKDTSAGDPSFGWGSYTINNYGELIVEGGTIEHLGEQNQPDNIVHMICAIQQASGTTTINGGTISTPNYRSLRVNGGTITINDGNMNGQVWAQPSSEGTGITINGGTFQPMGGDFSSVFVENETYNVKFSVTGGTFNTKIGCSDANELAGSITGGTFTEIAKNNTSEALLGNKYGFVQNENGTYDVKKGDYLTLGEFVQAVNEAEGNYDGQGALVKIMVKSGDARTETIEGLPNRLQKYTNPEVYYAQYQRFAELTDVNISNVDFEFVPAAVTVADAWNTAGATTTVENINGELQFMNNGKVTLTNCTFNMMSVSPINAAELKITDCTFNGLQAYAIKDIKSATVNINNNTFTNCNGGFWFADAPQSITANNNTFTGVGRRGGIQFSATGDYTNSSIEIKDNNVEGAILWQLNNTVTDDQLKGIFEDNTYTEKYVTGSIQPVAMIGDARFTSLQAAIDAVQNDETIEFIADLEQTDGVLITDKNITIDLNGKTFAVSEGANTNNRNFKIDGSSVVTIKNGTMVAEGDYSSGAYGTVRTEGKANVTLENVKLYNYRGNGLNVKALSGTTVTINNSEVYSQYGGGIEAAGGEIELTNVKVKQKGMYTAPYNSMAISVNGGGKATVNSGQYTTECITAEEANGQGTSHGPWAAGVLNSGGTLIIKGGTFSNDNYGENSLATAARGLLLADTGAKIEIEGGIFNAFNKIIDIQNNLGDTTKNPSVTLNGGDFSANPLTWDEFIKAAEGKAPVQGADGRWTLEDAVMDKVGLKAAFEEGGNIVLGADITISETLVLAIGKTAVLDLNGKTLAAADKNTIKNEGGNLTIKNGTVTRTGDVVGYSVNNASGEITVKDATVERGLYTSGSKMTATNANISHNQSTRHAIYAWNCEVIINSGTFHNDNAGNATLMASGSSVVTINGGTFSIADGRSTLGWTSSMIDQNNTAQVLVKGGLFNGGFRINSADTKLTIEGGEFNTNNGSAFTDNSGTKVVEGGKFTDAGAQNWAKKYIAEGYEMNANGEVVAK